MLDIMRYLLSPLYLLIHAVVLSILPGTATADGLDKALSCYEAKESVDCFLRQADARLAAIRSDNALARA